MRRSTRLSNLNGIDDLSDSNSWYQSPRSGRSVGSIDGETENSRIEETRDYDAKDSDQFKRKLWHLRRKEVLKRLDRLNLRETGFSISKPQPSLFLSRKMKKARCYLCFSRGHMYWSCPNMNKRVYFKERNSQELGGCIKSKKKITRTFADKLIIPSPIWTVLGSDENGWNEIWYISDEYPRHMTANISLFKHFKKGSIGTSSMEIKVEGFGEVVVSTEARNYLVAGVYLVPNCALNVLSLQQLIVQGFRVRFQNTKAIIERAFEGEYDKEKEEVSDGESINDKDGICKKEDLHQLDCIQEKAIKEVFKYYNSLDELSLEEILDGKRIGKMPTKNEFESLIGFMKMVSEDEIKEGCKRLVKEHFERLVEWFYKDYLNCEERVTPVEIHGVEICLLDVYLTVQGFGGHVYVTTKDKWEDVAKALGFSSDYARGIKVYMTHLGLLGAYYDTATRYSRDELAPKAKECKGASEALGLGLPKGEDLRGGIKDTGMEESVKKADCCKQEDDVFIFID